MECNKDEASRAKSIAEAKLEQKDFAGAKKFALKAQNLYPGLNGISQMLTTLDVYISSEKIINGQVDWYGVLGVGPADDDETLKKQYRKLALMLHPDKNKSTGADGAFKLISEAWGLLSDKAKRSAYNLITGRLIPSMVYPGGRCTQPGGLRNHTGSPCIWPGGPPGPATEGSFTKFAKRKPPAPKPQKKSAKMAPAPFHTSTSPANQMVESFWTICGKCKIRYEYDNLYRNMTLLCPNCKTPFMATEIPRPVAKSWSSKLSASVPVEQQQQIPVNNNNSCAPPSATNDWGKNVDAKKWGLSQGGLNISTHIQNSGSGQTAPDISVHSQRGPLPVPTSVNGAACPSVVAKVTFSENKLKWPMHAEFNDAMDRVTKKRKLEGHDSHIIEREGLCMVNN